MFIGFDIGGTKCAVVLAKADKNDIFIIDRIEEKTNNKWQDTLDKLIYNTNVALQRNGFTISDISACGVSCGGPLDSENGLILSPPNLVGWDNVPICDYIYSALKVKATLKNDADACALAEWRYGAGRGYNNMIFLTCGTGLGAGLILNGKLYGGASNMAGEVGHIRLQQSGGVGYGKRGSFEGLCSGGGIAQTSKTYLLEKAQSGVATNLCSSNEQIERITAKDIIVAAKKGDIDAIAIMTEVGQNYGRGLAILIDLLNPEIIVGGGVFMRGFDLLKDGMYSVLQKECLKNNLSAVKIAPSKLGERIGDYGAIVCALSFFE